ncbi:DUF6671 family protein [Aphanothece sacrum]|nr:DUF6671 family protein [Aphanothece sacrum]
MLSNSIKSWFANRNLVIATMHKKEQVIMPLVEAELGVNCITIPDFNTDQFGTFTRDINRRGTQIEAARKKAQTALEITGETLAIASEGSFMSHPAFPFVSCDREIVLLLDQKHDLEIIGQEISTETNHTHQSIKTLDEALNFAEKTKFPDHGLVVMLSPKSIDKNYIYKGINTENKLIETVEKCLKQSNNGTIHIETDMRAMFNPTRMKVIEKATQNLIKTIYQQCPQCYYPGFDVIKRQSGLPCGLCGLATDSILLDIYQCQQCNFSQEKKFPTGIETADPSQCQYCNP